MGDLPTVAIQAAAEIERFLSTEHGYYCLGLNDRIGVLAGIIAEKMKGEDKDVCNRPVNNKG